jgi:hypothetical protein
MMSNPPKRWDPDLVGTWLERRLVASRLDQSAADRRGYEARDDYDKAAAEEWVCRALKDADCTKDQASFAARIKALIGQEEYPATGMNDDTRFDRHVRAQLRKLAKMAKANEGFEKKLHYQ